MEAGGTAAGSTEVDWTHPPEGLRGRILFSILMPIGWLVFTLLYVGFWATGFSVFQSIVIIIVSALVLAGAMGSLWMWWGPRYAPRNRSPS